MTPGDGLPDAPADGSAEAATIGVVAAGPGEAVVAGRPSSPAAPTLPGRRLRFGAYVSDLPSGRTDLPALERQLGASLEVASYYADWSTPIGSANDRWLSAGGRRTVLIAWLRADPALAGQLNAIVEEAPSRTALPWLAIAASASADWSAKDREGRELGTASASCTF